MDASLKRQIAEEFGTPAVVIDLDSVKGSPRWQPVGRSGPLNMARLP